MMLYGGGLGGIGMFFIILFWIAVVLTIVLLLKNAGIFFKNTKDNEAINILKKKYANGEISKKEFLEKKEDLV